MVSPDNNDLPPTDAEDGPETEPAKGPSTSPQSKPRGGGLLKGIALIALLAGVGAYGAVSFRDQDPRLALVADYVEQAGAALGLMTAPGQIASHPAPAEVAAEEPRAAASEPEKPAELSPAITPETPRDGADEAARDAEKAAKLAAEKAEAEKAQAAEQAQAAEKAAEKAAKAAEEAARAAAAKTEREAAEAKAAAAAATPATSDADGLSAKDMATALEGRIDELAEELKALRERLDSPKNETRAAPESVAAPDSSAAQVVVAYTLQRELDAGRPYGAELAALKKLGAAEAPLAALAPSADNGAPTAAELRAAFNTAAKHMRLSDQPRSGDIAERLMEGASKLVKVRPSGQTGADAPQTGEERLLKIDAALAHGDFAAARAAFEALPESARAQAQSFGDSLVAREEAARAADALLHGAIGALGVKK